MNLDDPALLDRAAKLVKKATQAAPAAGSYAARVNAALSPGERYLSQMYRNPKLMVRDPLGRPVENWHDPSLGSAVKDTLVGGARIVGAPFEALFRSRHMHPGYFTGMKNVSGLSALADNLGNTMGAALGGEGRATWNGIKKTLYDANPFGSGVMGQRTRDVMATGIHQTGAGKRWWNSPYGLLGDFKRQGTNSLKDWKP